VRTTSLTGRSHRESIPHLKYARGPWCFDRCAVMCRGQKRLGLECRMCSVVVPASVEHRSISQDGLLPCRILKTLRDMYERILVHREKYTNLPVEYEAFGKVLRRRTTVNEDGSMLFKLYDLIMPTSTPNSLVVLQNGHQHPCLDCLHDDRCSHRPGGSMHWQLRLQFRVAL
jgi:hypothetical protein